MGGLCKEHHEEDLAEKRSREDALRLLHESKVDGSHLSNEETLTEYLRLVRWWDRACRARNFDRFDDVLQDEAEYAIEWCIAISTSLVEEERLFRKGLKSDPMLKHYREDIWTRFHNLEAGLMSNGVRRAAART